MHKLYLWAYWISAQIFPATRRCDINCLVVIIWCKDLFIARGILFKNAVTGIFSDGFCTCAISNNA